MNAEIQTDIEIAMIQESQYGYDYHFQSWQLPGWIGASFSTIKKQIIYR